MLCVFLGRTAKAKILLIDVTGCNLALRSQHVPHRHQFLECNSETWNVASNNTHPVASHFGLSKTDAGRLRYEQLCKKCMKSAAMQKRVNSSLTSSYSLYQIDTNIMTRNDTVRGNEERLFWQWANSWDPPHPHTVNWPTPPSHCRLYWQSRRTSSTPS